MLKICKICGREFETARAWQVVCSDECFHEKELRRKKKCRELAKKQGGADKPAVKRMAKPAVCVVCGKEFQAEYRGQKYCSEECHSDPLAKSLRRFFLPYVRPFWFGWRGWIR